MPECKGKLSARQEKFVEHYSISGNATEAARLAGYSKHTARVIGPENLLKPAIKEALADRLRVFRNELRVTKEEVLNGLLEAVQTSREQGNPATMVSAWAQIARLCGFYCAEVQRLELDFAGASMKAKFAAMSDDELIAIVTGQESHRNQHRRAEYY